MSYCPTCGKLSCHCPIPGLRLPEDGPPGVAAHRAAVAKARAALAPRVGDQRDRLRELLAIAWGVIANAHGGNWQLEDPIWQAAAARWRDDYFRLLRVAAPPVPDEGMACPHVPCAVCGKPACTDGDCVAHLSVEATAGGWCCSEACWEKAVSMAEEAE